MMRFVTTTLLLCAAAAGQAGAEIPSPAEHFGHQVGADRQLIPYPDLLAYLELVAAASDRVSIEEAGSSTLGNPMPVIVLTSPENQQRLPRLREISRRLAHPERADLAAPAALVDEGRVIALVTCTIHSTEVGSTQMVAEFVHQFATTEDPERLAWMDEAVLLVMPSVNPDGQILVADWYRRWLGTDYEGGRMPWLYHHYVGHDNNRDFYMLTQKETRVVNDVLYHRWFPQVFLDEHQMGSTGPRMFVPPQTDPLDPEVHSLVFRQADSLGTNMSLRLEEAAKTGVGHDMIFDSYWPGGTRNTAWWKNVTGLLTEVASARIATPMYIDPNELRGEAKGLPEYQRRSNFPSPWPGGWWRLRDIVEYELVATWAFLEGCAENRSSILTNVDRMAREAMARGAAEAPYAFVVPPRQHDAVAAARLVALLQLHGVRVLRASEDFEVGYAAYPAGTTVIPAAQPFRPFLLTMLRPQRYPEVRADAAAPILEPYDVTSWSLPLLMGVEVAEAEQPLEAVLEPLTDAPWPAAAIDPRAAGHLIPASADSAYAAINNLLAEGYPVARLARSTEDASRGDVYLDAAEVPTPVLEDLAATHHLPLHAVSVPPDVPMHVVGATRVGLFKPWVASMDEGWTRFLLESYGFPFASLDNDAMRSGDFADRIDVLLLPSVDPSIIATGEPEGERARRWWSPLPPEYSGGIDVWPAGDGGEAAAAKERRPGGERIAAWVKGGGTVVALGDSGGYLIELLDLPVEDVLEDVGRDRFNCPGTSLRVLMAPDSPLTFGMRREEVIYFADSAAYRTRPGDGRVTRRVIARFPDDERDILASGFLAGGELLERRAAAVEFEVGKGRVILIGFPAQHRAQPLRTFKLLFNALYDLRPDVPES